MKREELAELSKEQLIEIIPPLNERIAQQDERIAQQDERIARLEAELAELKGPKGKSAADWVKSNRPKKEPGEKRRKRAPEQNHGRCIETPTRSVDHHLDHCPE